MLFYYLMDLHYSQTYILFGRHRGGFTTLWIYTILKHRCHQRSDDAGFTTLWIYTILKRFHSVQKSEDGFTTLWIYTILKHYWIRRAAALVLLPYGFTLFSNNHRQGVESMLFYYLMDLHYSQTCRGWSVTRLSFYYLMDLHYSQTSARTSFSSSPFYYLMDLHYSQTRGVYILKYISFTTLWIYTILKLS